MVAVTARIIQMRDEDPGSGKVGHIAARWQRDRILVGFRKNVSRGKIVKYVVGSGAGIVRGHQLCADQKPRIFKFDEGQTLEQRKLRPSVVHGLPKGNRPLLDEFRKILCGHTLNVICYGRESRGFAE